MKRTLRVAVTVVTGSLLLSLGVNAAQTNYDIGKTGAAELKVGLGARPVAMGETFVGKDMLKGGRYGKPW